MFGRARWIWPDSHHWDLHNGYALFRRRFTLPAAPAEARLFITADQSYRLYVNDHYVARGPARGVQRSWPYDEIDVGRWLRAGDNVIAIRAHNPGFSTFQYLSEGYAGVLVAGTWCGVRIDSGPGWKAVRQSSVQRDTVPCSLQLYAQEHIDLREDPRDWTSGDFDDTGWPEPVGRPWNSGPWFGLEPRGIPMLAERTMRPAALAGVGAGDCAAGHGRVRDVVALRRREDRGHAPTGAQPDTLRVPPSGRGRFRSHLLDFGRTVVGSLVVTVRGAQGGEIIDTHLGETVDLETLTIDQIADAGSRMAFGDRLVCRAGDQTHRFYHHYGFRYLDLTVRDACAELDIEVELNWVGYPLERRGSFACSDPLLERIWEACAWTQQCCSLDAYVDTPWREQAQWWGDARVQAWNTFHLSGDARLLRRGIAQIAGQTTPDGVTYGHAPTMAHGCVLPDFTLIWFLTIWDHYWQTGSTEPLTTHARTIEGALAYFRDHTDPASGLVTYDERYWLFLDWIDIFKDGAPALYNLWLLLALDKLATLHRAAGDPGKAAPLEAWAGELRAALARLVDEDGLMRDGVDRSGNIVRSTSLHCQVLAAAADIPGHRIDVAEERLLLPYLAGLSLPVAQPSAYWVTYLFSHLATRGYGREVVDFIRRHWERMADYGTTWENFEPKKADESFSHAWSAHPLFHLMQIIGGVRQSKPAWEEIEYAPVFDGDHADVTVPTPLGLLRAVWRRSNDGAIRVELTLPRGMRAKVTLPGRAPTWETGEFAALIQADENLSEIAGGCFTGNAG